MNATMPKSRLEAFSDGVIAVIITIMVLEMKVPHGADPASLLPLWPVFLAYVLSYIYVGIADLRDGHSARIRAVVARLRPVHRRRRDLVCTRSADRGTGGALKPAPQASKRRHQATA